MAKMFPERLSEYVLSNPKLEAERTVYYALQSLSEKFFIFYSVGWLGRNGEDGEADFIVAHPNYGILVLEVKGGGIHFDAETGLWTSQNRKGEQFAIKDPALQATKNKHALIRKFRELPNWPDRWLTAGISVVFPDVKITSRALRPDIPQNIVIDNERLHDIEKTIIEILDFYRKDETRSGSPGHDRMRLIVDILGKSFSLRTPLGVELAKEDERIVELTEQQMRLLELLSFQRRAAIGGCAGSGKTMLAMEKAKRLSKEGFDVLLVCFSANLAKYLAKHASDGVSVFHFHGLCNSLSKEAGIWSIPPLDSDKFYNQFLPDKLLESIESLGPQFDAIVVDEGQDFKETWWLALNELLRDSRQGIIYAFFDDNQNLFHGVTQIPGIIDAPPFPLSENCRNTQEIAGLVAQYHREGLTLKSRGPKGRVPNWILYADKSEMFRELRKVLHHLINEENIEPEDIVILTPRAEERSELKEKLELGNFEITRKPPSQPNQILVNSIHQFKGLERRVVVIVELDQQSHIDKNLILYVGCSRARLHLTLLYHHSFEIHTSKS